MKDLDWSDVEADADRMRMERLFDEALALRHNSPELFGMMMYTFGILARSRPRSRDNVVDAYMMYQYIHVNYEDLIKPPDDEECAYLNWVDQRLLETHGEGL